MNVKIQSSYYFFRLLARAMDLIFVSLILLFVQAVKSDFQGNLLIWFLVYNLVVVAFKGKSLGKYSFSLTINSSSTGFRKSLSLMVREILILLLLPILAFNLLFLVPIPLHDRISGTQVTRNEP